MKNTIRKIFTLFSDQILVLLQKHNLLIFNGFNFEIPKNHKNKSFIINDLQSRLLPLDRRRWFTRNVVNNPVQPAHFVDDAVRDAAEQFVRQVSPVGGHEVAGDYSA